MAIAEDASSGGYEQLQQRAYRFIAERGGAVFEESLIEHVFGSARNAALWRPLLRQVLDGDDRLSLRSDGQWSLRTSRPAAGDLPRDYLVVDVETTGLRPYRQRLIEVAAIRYRDGVRQDIFSTLLNPERRVPAYISQLTGIDEARLTTAPTFRRVADQLLRFLGEDLIVGYNVGFDVGFINAELQRVGEPSLVNNTLDLLPLSMQLVPGLRRSGLGALCHTLEIGVRERHRATEDAEATALVFARLLPLARASGLNSLESLQRAAVQVPVPRQRGPVGRGRAVLDRSHLAEIPRSPGVYLMRDAHDRVIYVGKAKNLHNRVSSYYSQPLGYTRKMDGLLESIQRIETIETGSELEALLLESQLIRRHSPQFNTQQRNTEAYPYIKVDVGNPWPRVTLIRRRADDDAVYFGPFRVARAARDVVDLIHEIFPLRTCPRSFRNARSLGSPCLHLALGRCAGPCVGAADRDSYRQAVYDVIGFLRGEREDVIRRLHGQLTECAERLDFERAARLRDRIRRVQQLVLSQQLLDDTVQRGQVLVVTPSPVSGARELLMVFGGRLWAQIRCLPDDDDEEVASRLERSWRRATERAQPPIDQDSLDQVHILGRWLRKHSDYPAILPLDGDAPDWREVTRRARALTPQDLAYDRPPESRPDPGVAVGTGNALC